MALTTAGSAGLLLERIFNEDHYQFTTPSKKIHDGDDLNFFLSSTAYRDLMTWILQLNRSMFPTEDTYGKIQQSRLDSPPPFSTTVQNLRKLISSFEDLVESAPPDTGPRRFGNVAFRTWYKLAEETADNLCEHHLGYILEKHEQSDPRRRTAVKDELKVYLLGSFGSAQRLDYGTGHELSFLAFLASLWKLGAFEGGEEKAIVMGVVQPYLELIRHLVLTYTLEPAGSHGVWGLDDHSFVPYIFGSAQCGPTINPSDHSTPVPTEGSLKGAPSPTKVTDKDIVAAYKDQNMYFSAIQFIYDVKRGPFWEHSPVLYDISGIKDGWAKINKGMLKMYAAEVLGKFPVVQHFPFGSLFRWEAEPEAANEHASMHAQQQPPAKSMDVPSGPLPGAGIKAPWAKSGGGAAMPPMQASTGVPTTRAPWAGIAPSSRPPSGGSGMSHDAVRRAPFRRQAPGVEPGTAPGIAPMAPPWSSGQAAPATGSNMPPPTTAPWAKKT